MLSPDELDEQLRLIKACCGDTVHMFVEGHIVALTKLVNDLAEQNKPTDWPGFAKKWLDGTLDPKDYQPGTTEKGQ